MKLLVELDTGETAPLNSCQFVLWKECGCPRGVTKAGTAYNTTVDDAWKDFFPTKRLRDAAVKRGLRMELMTHTRYVADVMPLMLTGCTHAAEATLGQEAPHG